jgi:hypothetical protein
MELDRKLKTALDESRLLILGAQVLFGFQFQSVLQELFAEVPWASRLVQCRSLSRLIAPSLHDQIIYGGETRQGALRDAAWFAGISLLPLTLGLALRPSLFLSIFSAAAWGSSRGLYSLSLRSACFTGLAFY